MAGLAVGGVFFGAGMEGSVGRGERPVVGTAEAVREFRRTTCELLSFDSSRSSDGDVSRG